jgi:hypothetical protein
MTWKITKSIFSQLPPSRGRVRVGGKKCTRVAILYLSFEIIPALRVKGAEGIPADFFANGG